MDVRCRGAKIWINGDRWTARHIPLSDLILQKKLQEAMTQNITAYPCSNCDGGWRNQLDVIREYFVVVDRDHYLMKFIIGGNPLDGYPLHGNCVEDITFDNDVVDDDPILSADYVVHDNVEGVPGHDPVDGDATLWDELYDVQKQVLEALD